MVSKVEGFHLAAYSQVFVQFQCQKPALALEVLVVLHQNPDCAFMHQDERVGPVAVPGWSQRNRRIPAALYHQAIVVMRQTQQAVQAGHPGALHVKVDPIQILVDAVAEAEVRNLSA